VNLPKLLIASAAAALMATPAWALPGQAPTNSGTANAPSTTPAGPPSTTPAGPPSTTPAGPPSTTPPSNQGTAHKPSTPGTSSSLPAKAKAYGTARARASSTSTASTGPLSASA
jgi:hypothetical protein